MAYIEYRFPNGMILSQFTEDDAPAEPTAEGATLIEQLADRVRQQRSVKWSTIPTDEARRFHQRDTK